MSFMGLSNIFEINEENEPDGSFSFSLSNEKEVNRQDIDKTITSSIQHILNKSFAGEKTRIAPYRGRLNFACPYCGDSHADHHKKRGNVYLANYMFKCFNCGKTTGVSKFLKDHSVDLKMSEITYIITNTNNGTVYDKTIDPYFLYDKEGLVKLAIDRRTIEEKFGLVPIDRSKIYIWLSKRLQSDFTKYSWNEKKQQLYIFHIIPETTKVLGYQIRNFSSYPKYMTFKLSKVYEQLGYETTDELTEIDKISTSFGILNLELSKPITVFEGPLDSFLFKNAVASCGDKNDFPLETENVRFFYDCDDPGRKCSIQKIKEGKKVFLWKKFLQDSKIPESTKKLDLSEILVYAKRKGIKLPNFNEYFSDSHYDLYWI